MNTSPPSLRYVVLYVFESLVLDYTCWGVRNIENLYLTNSLISKSIGKKTITCVLKLHNTNFGMTSKVDIGTNQYQVIETLNDISLSDSFVLPINKIVGAGSGEAKLYLGYEGEKLNAFFGRRGFCIDCIMTRDQLIEFHNISRLEYFNPTQEYREKNQLETIWEERRDKILKLPEILTFQAKDQTQITGPRIYINSNDESYTLLREIPLPIVSHLSIVKVQNIIDETFSYLFHLISDYKDEIEIEEPNSIRSDETDPFDPELISIDTRKITMETLLRRLKQGTINLNPDFQRNEVWTLEKKCQLIESLMLKIPLPMFYVSSDEKSNFTVVDGLQRLSTIRDFLIEHKFTLQRLEFWGDQFNNKTLKDLPTHIENRILETEFTFTVINPGTPDVVKRNIFKRVNRGGAPLTDQEIRHALYSGRSTEFLKELSTSTAFKNVTDGSIRNNRMLDREFILRLLAFILRDYLKYPKNGNMDAFLSDTLQIINFLPNLNSADAQKQLKKVDIENIKVLNLSKLNELFEKSMTRAAEIFGEHAFRKSYDGKRRTPVNKALFEVWGTLLANISDKEYYNLMKNRNDFLEQYTSLYLKNYNFDEIISRNALKQSSVIERYNKLAVLLNNYIND